MQSDNTNTLDATVERLIKEAHEILESANLNDERNKLKGIFNQLAIWNENQNEQDEYIQAYQKVLLSMGQLDFSKRLTINSKQKTIQNLISYSLNMVNEELEERVFPKTLVELMLKELKLENVVIVGTDADGKITLFHTDKEELFPPYSTFRNQNINIFFDDMNEINQLIRNGGIKNGIKVRMKFGYKGIVNLRIANPSWLKISEGSVYIIEVSKNL